MMKNAFYFMIKALFLEIMTYFSLNFDCVKSGFEEKVMVIFKIYCVTGWTRSNYNNLVSNISRIKGNQAIKFCQLTEYT